MQNKLIESYHWHIITLAKMKYRLKLLKGVIIWDTKK